MKDKLKKNKEREKRVREKVLRRRMAIRKQARDVKKLDEEARAATSKQEPFRKSKNISEII